MEFKSIETALTEIVGDDRFYGTASLFEVTLIDNNLTPREKAMEIAQIIREHNTNTNKSKKL